jgi:hypothetical protein
VVGAFTQGGVLRLSLSTEHSQPTGPFPFLGRVFGDQRLLREWRFLREQLLVARFSPWITLGGGGWWW